MAEEDKPEEDKPEIIWVISNRQDNRVVLFERDPAHPGGEAFIGGSAPEQVARTGTVEGLLRAGLIVEIPEPPDGPKKPVQLDAVNFEPPAAQPGQAVKLGRKLDSDLVPAGAADAVQKRQADLPKEIPVPPGGTVPPRPQTERETRRS